MKERSSLVAPAPRGGGWRRSGDGPLLNSHRFSWPMALRGARDVKELFALDAVADDRSFPL